jgi:hypothetical protein
MARVLDTDNGQLLTGSVHAHSLEARDMVVIGGRVSKVTSAHLDAAGIRLTFNNRGMWYARTNDMFDRVIGGVTRG